MRKSTVAVIVLAAAPSTLLGSSEVTLRDSTGATVGPILSIVREGFGEFEALVPLRIHGQKVLLQFNRTSFTALVPALLRYKSVDCTGQPYLQDGVREIGASLLPWISIIGMTVYVPDRTVPISDVQTESYWEFRVNKCFAQSDTNRARPALSFDLASAFTPPFRVTYSGVRTFP